MAGRNHVELMGNLTKNAEVRYTQSGQAVTSFRIACNEKYFAGGEQKERTEFINVIIWGKRGQAMSKAGLLNKGQGLFIEGRLQTRSYPHAEHEGVKMYVTEVVTNVGDGAIQLLGRGSGSQAQPPEDVPPPSDDDLPEAAADDSGDDFAE